MVINAVEVGGGTRRSVAEDLGNLVRGDRVKGRSEVDPGRTAPVGRQVREVIKSRRKEL